MTIIVAMSVLFPTHQFLLYKPPCACSLFLITEDRESFLLHALRNNSCARLLSYFLYHTTTPSNHMSLQIHWNRYKFTL